MNKQQLLKAIGSKIKEIRIEKEVSQQQLASDCNFEKSNMSRIEAGRSNITIHTLNKIAQALDAELKDFVDF